jgi:mannose-6-phosphate isomerase
MNQISLYPLRFEPIHQYRLWGGRRLANLLSAPLPREGPISEAWLLSNRDDHPSASPMDRSRDGASGSCFRSQPHPDPLPPASRPERVLNAKTAGWV